MSTPSNNVGTGEGVQVALTYLDGFLFSLYVSSTQAYLVSADRRSLSTFYHLPHIPSAHNGSQWKGSPNEPAFAGRLTRFCSLWIQPIWCRRSLVSPGLEQALP